VPGDPGGSPGDPGATPDGAGGPPARVAALVHGLGILDLFGDDATVVTVAAMAREIGVHRSNASRLAATLHSLGYLSRAAGNTGYRLGPRLVQLGRLASRNIDVIQRTTEPLQELVRQTGETGHVGILDGVEVVTVSVVDGWHPLRMHSQVNKRSPAHCSAMGKALLSGLDDGALRTLFGGHRPEPRTPASITSVTALVEEIHQVRGRGVALDREELEPGLRCIAAPVVGADGAVVASLGLSGPSLRLTDATLDDLVQPIRAAAARAAVALGARPGDRSA
jgi:DNA-binding IclR family transcriptional regulator